MTLEACMMSAILMGVASTVSALPSFGPLVTPAQLSESLDTV